MPCQHENRSRRKALLARDRPFLMLAVGDHEQSGQVAVMIEGEVQFHRPLGPAKHGPGKHLRAQIDDGRIETEQLVFESKRLGSRDGLTPRKHLVEDGLIELPGPVRIGVRERRPARDGRPEMRQPTLAAGQAATDLPQRMRPPELGKQHGDELIPAGKPARMPLGLRVLHRTLELEARK
jgi:hypothetical protein